MTSFTNVLETFEKFYNDHIKNELVEPQKPNNPVDISIPDFSVLLLQEHLLFDNYPDILENNNNKERLEQYYLSKKELPKKWQEYLKEMKNYEKVYIQYLLQREQEKADGRDFVRKELSDLLNQLKATSEEGENCKNIIKRLTFIRNVYGNLVNDRDYEKKQVKKEFKDVLTIAINQFEMDLHKTYKNEEYSKNITIKRV